MTLKNGRKNKLFFRQGSALILTMFIMAGMLIVAISSSYIVALGIKAGGIQAQSTKAYFIAEAGAERFLWELRQNGADYDQTPGVAIYQNAGSDLMVGASYEVFRVGNTGIVYRSVGDFGNTRRSVELSM